MGMRNTIAMASVLVGLAAGASAQETTTVLLDSGFGANVHEVILVEDSFYPTTTYLNAGDQVVFINLTGNNASATASDQSWTTGDLPIEGSFTLDIASDTQLEFNLRSITLDAGGNPVAHTAGVGYISFDPAPIN